LSKSYKVPSFDVKHWLNITTSLQSNAVQFFDVQTNSTMRFWHFGILSTVLVAAPIYGSPLEPLEPPEDGNICKVGKHHPCPHDGFSRCCAGAGGYALCDGNIWTHVACGTNELCVQKTDKNGNDEKHHVECMRIPCLEIQSPTSTGMPCGPGFKGPF
jgi:hypothetical protein